MNSRRAKILLGIIVSNAVGLLIIRLSIWCATRIHAGTLVASNFVIIPMLMGMISAYIWKDALQRTRDYVLYSLLNTIIALGASWVFLMEGVICLVIVSPILFGFVLLGTLITRSMILKNPKIGVHVMPLALVILISDSLSPPFYKNAVTDSVVVNAPAQIVWQYVPAFPPVETPMNYWLFSLGLPQPIETKIEGPFVGAWRKCIFSGNLTFEEQISEYKEGAEITFEVKKQPFDPEIFNHVTIERGKMALHDNGDGTTTLTGTTWYQLHAFPAWYYERWADSIGRAVHLQVMQHIKELAEHQHESS